MLKCEQNEHSFPTYNHITMDKNPTLVINCNNFIVEIKRKFVARIASLMAIKTTWCKTFTISHPAQSL
jgi:hypothetical protein